MSSSQLLCAISYSAKRLGAALYDEDEREVKLLTDLAEDDDFIMLSRFLREVKPTHILANRSQDAEFQMVLRRECNNLNTELVEGGGSRSQPEQQKLKQHVQQSTSAVSVVPDSMNGTHCQLLQTQTRLLNSSSGSGDQTPNARSNIIQAQQQESAQQQQPAADDENNNEGGGGGGETIWRPSLSLLPDISYSFGHSRRKLEQVFGEGGPNDQLTVSFRFDFTATNMIRSLGALFRFIEQQNMDPTNETDFKVRSCIDKVTGYTISDCIEVDSATLRALEIFYSDYIPQTIRRKFVWGNNRREGMSLFKLCNLCRSTPGKHMLRMWFERPTKDIAMLSDRHEAIHYLYQDCNMESVSQLHNFMKDIASIKGIFKRMRRGNLPITDWKNFFTTVCTLTKIGTCLTDREVNIPILREKFDHIFGSELQSVACQLIEVIDFQETLSENRLSIRRGLNKELDKKKDIYEKLPEELTAVAKMEAKELSAASCSLAYVPILGYMLMIPQDKPIPPSPAASLIELMFASDGMNYYKSKRMRLLDENVGDIKMQIIDLETNIVIVLQEKLLKSRQTVLNAVELAATLDCLISLSIVARKYNWTRPTFVSEPVLLFQEARHPIAEHLCNSGEFVPNPILSSTQVGKVKVLFGPNASGKSVFLKMMGTIVYMSYIGCFVPARKATIGPINRIMSRLYTVDSVLDGMSSFATDLKQMSRAITRSDEHSLLIIDEFGKGTMTEVGLSLLASSLNYWLDGPMEKCPHVIVASHFHSLPELLRDPNQLLRYQTMGVTRHDDDTLDFHYNLTDGVAELSYATFTALKMGIPREVVDRSEEVYVHLRAGFTLSEIEPIAICLMPELADEEVEQEEEQQQHEETQQQMNVSTADRQNGTDKTGPT